METIQLPGEHTETVPSSLSSVAPRTQCQRRLSLLVMLVLVLVGGIIGGILSPTVMNSLRKRAPVPTPTSFQNPTVISTDDDAVVNLVNQNAPGVVSIIISRDVPKVRNFFGSPFFMDPFGMQGQGNGGQGNGSDSGSGTQKQKIGSGSGFLVTADGLIVTNKHVVSDTQADYTVITSDGKEYSAKVLARDPSNDIAVVKIDGRDLPALRLGNSDQVKVGQSVVAIGNPLGEFSNSATRGIISGLKRSVAAGSGFGDSEQLSDIIQTDAAINPGNSGGPLFNLSGEVVGVNVAMAQGAENIGFALPINQVKRIVEQVRTTGKITTPYIGVRYVVLNDDLQKQNNLPFNYGALVLRGQNITDFAVVPGSPADQAGLVENDIILEVNGTKVETKNPLANLINTHNVGDTITLKVWHKGETKDVSAKLEERKAQ